MPDLQLVDVEGVREHLIDILIEVDAPDYPLFSLCPKGERPRSPIMQQPVDKQGFTNKRGVRNKTPATATNDKYKDYGLLESNIHWIRDEIGVGEKDRVVANRAGIGLGKIYAGSLTKGIVSTKAAIDQVLGDNFDQRDEGEVDGSETRGLVNWGSPTAQACRAVPERFRPKTAQRVECNLSEVTPSTISKMLNARYNVTHSAGKMLGFCGIDLKDVFSNWSMYLPDKASHTAIRRFEGESSREKAVLSAVVDFLNFDGGSIELHKTANLLTDRDSNEDTEVTTLSTSSMLCLPQDSMSIHFAQDIEHRSLGFDGGNESGILSTMFATQAKPWDICTVLCAA